MAGKLCMNLQTYWMSTCRPLAVFRRYPFDLRRFSHMLFSIALLLTTQNIVLRLLRPALEEPSYSFLGSTP
ncbi:hypothetical protein BDR04DRAFT_466199 [Suillus decipiens]|nr:hypothetical protein BDR04DRAFT_466199 [Suillus decipiens]